MAIRGTIFAEPPRWILAVFIIFITLAVGYYILESFKVELAECVRLYGENCTVWSGV